jgi:Domain of unknown function (DUF4328)
MSRTCPRCGGPVAEGELFCANCGARWALDQPSVPVPIAPARPPTPMSGLSTATAVSLGLVGLCYLTDTIALLVHESVGIALSATTVLSFVVVVPLFLIWFFLVRRNSGGWGPQRHAQGWAIGGWFVPVIFLWFPFQIADDAWQASQPVGQQPRSRGIVVGWWICWLLAWFTGFYDRHTISSSTNGTSLTQTSVGFQLGSNVVSAAFTAAAALLCALMVHTLGRMQRARISAGTAIYQ